MIGGISILITKLHFPLTSGAPLAGCVINIQRRVGGESYTGRRDGLTPMELAAVAVIFPYRLGRPATGVLFVQLDKFPCEIGCADS